MMMAQTVTPIQRLIQLGCMMWFPLDQDNGVNDVVGGHVITEVYSDAFTYNSGQQMNLVKTRPHKEVVANIAIDFSQGQFLNDGWTTIVQMKRYSTNIGTQTRAPIFNLPSGIIFLCLNASGTAAAYNWNANMQTTVLVCNLSGRKIYNNGTKIIDDSTVYPEPWGNSNISVHEPDDSNNNKYIYVRNVLLFNRTLTEAEIAEAMSILGIPW